MARRKKQRVQRGVGAAVVGLVVLFVVFPSETWIVVGMVAGAGFYLYQKFKRDPAEASRTVARDRAVHAENRVSLEPSLRVASSRSQFASDDEKPMRTFAARAPTSRSFRIPAAPKGYGSAAWVPAEEVVEIGGVSIPGGMVYVGTSLEAPTGGPAPCLIDPSKSVASHGDYTERRTDYWPSYARISPSARRAYLNWLADGRQDPEADIGYVFLFFYGLERRAIVDAARDDAAKAEWPVIAAELRRLLGIYGAKSGSFRRYAGSLLDWVWLAAYPPKLYLKPVPDFSETSELPLYIRVALGQAAVDGVAIPASLALAWVRLDPAGRLRTPATRCADEFEKLFVYRYHEVFGPGLVLPRNKTKVKLIYRPASAGLLGYKQLNLSFGDTPDVTVLTAPIKKLRQVAEAATKELESFSRYVGRNPDAQYALEGLLLLPARLWPENARKTLLAIKERVGDGMISMSFQELLAGFDVRTVFTKDRTLALARTLKSLDIGIEPDVLNGARRPKPDENIVLFAVPSGETANRPTPAYRMAALTLDLASAVAAADGDFSVEEMGHLRKRVQSWVHLEPGQIRRLLAHLRLLMTAPASLTVLRKKLELLDADARQAIAAVVIAVAQSDGEVAPAEVRMLEKIYKALGVEPDQVFSDLHAVATGAKPTTATAVTAKQAGFRLDPARIAALQRDTERVSALLSSIFEEEDDQPEPAPVELEPEIDATEPSHDLLGLDEAHSALARLLLSRPEWTREELGDVAADMDLMIDGAIEILNDAAFDNYDMPFTEGEDVVMVNPELLERLAA